MAREMIMGHVACAEQHVKDGAVIVERQRGLIAELWRDGHETLRAAELLATLVETQRAHIADRDRLQRELAAYDAQGQ